MWVHSSRGGGAGSLRNYHEIEISPASKQKNSLTIKHV